MRGRGSDVRGGVHRRAVEALQAAPEFFGYWRRALVSLLRYSWCARRKSCAERGPAPCQSAVMPTVTVEPFQPRHAAAAGLAAWCAVFRDGQRDLCPVARSRHLLWPSGSWLRSHRQCAGPPAAVLARRSAGSRSCGGSRTSQVLVSSACSLRRRAAAVASASPLLFEAMRSVDASGIDRLQSMVLAGPPGDAFARAVPGSRVVLRLELQEQRLDQEWVLARCRELVASPPSAYRLVHWIGLAPEQLAASFGRVMGHVLDAPGAVLQMPPRTWNTAAVRAWEAQMTTGGDQLMVSTAVHSAFGEVVAATVATVPASGGPVADQHDTAVLPEHRRQGLARWIEAQAPSHPAPRALPWSARRRLDRQPGESAHDGGEPIAGIPTDSRKAAGGGAGEGKACQAMRGRYGNASRIHCRSGEQPSPGPKPTPEPASERAWASPDRHGAGSPVWDGCTTTAAGGNTTCSAGSRPGRCCRRG